MEDLPVILDDGEMWLPSDIFPNEEHQINHNRPIPATSTPMDDLSRPFSNLNFQGHHPIITPKLPSIPQQLEVQEAMAEYRAVTNPPTIGSYGLTVGPFGVDFDHGCHFPGPNHPVPHFPMPNPVYPMANEQFMETRIARSHRPMYYRQQQNTLFPIPPYRCGLGFGFGFGLARDCHSSSSTSSGTGVFIPRTTTLSHVGNKPVGGLRTRVKSSKLPPPRNLGARNAEDYYYHHQPHSREVVALPKDWSY